MPKTTKKKPILSEDELREAILKIVHEANLEAAVKEAPQASLKIILGGLALPQLKKQAKHLALKNIAKTERAALEKKSV